MLITRDKTMRQMTLAAVKGVGVSVGMPDYPRSLTALLSSAGIFA